MQKQYKHLISVFLALILIALLYFDYVSAFAFLTLLNKILFAIVVLMGFGILIQKAEGFDGTYFGIYWIGTKKGLNLVAYLSKKYKNFLDALSLWGLFLGFGFLSYKFFKNEIKRTSFLKIAAIGIITIIFISLILPFLSIITLQLIKIPQLSSLSVANVSVSTIISQYSSNYVLYVFLLISVIAGFSGLMFVLLFFSTYITLSQISASVYKYILTINSGHPIYTAPSNIIPGVIPVIPGIDIPLFAGIISLVIIIVIHELSHGILAKSFKIKIKSMGIVLFGIIPIGAFVEPNEAEIKKLKKFKQTKILSAGPSANFFALIIFSIPSLLIFIFVLPHISSTGIFINSVTNNFPANNTLKPGMQILSWDGYKVSNISNFSKIALNDRPGQKISVVTNTGSYNFTAKQDPGNLSRGIIGITALEKQYIYNTPYSKSAYFFYSLFSLLFILNFFIAIVNLLPIPGLDGWRIYHSNIKSKKFINLLQILIIFTIVINIVPWFFII